MKKRLHGQTNRVGVDFLRIDSAIALTLSCIALQTSDRETRRRATHTARKAYATIMQLRKNIDFAEAERQKLEANLQRLRSELQSLGERRSARRAGFSQAFLMRAGCDSRGCGYEHHRCGNLDRPGGALESLCTLGNGQVAPVERPLALLQARQTHYPFLACRGRRVAPPAPFEWAC